MMKYKFFITLLTLLILLPTGISSAQESEPVEPLYIVQEGDTLWSIALRFRVPMDDLAQANGITDANQLRVGDQLAIPGLEGVEGILTTTTLAFGENLRSLSRHYQVPEDAIIQLNHLTSPYELYAGSTLVIPETANQSSTTDRYSLIPGQSLLELSVSQNTNPWILSNTNNLSGTWAALPGDVLHHPKVTPNEQEITGPGALPAEISAIEIIPDPLVQGKVTVIKLAAIDGLELGGTFNERPLHFFQDDNGVYFSFQGIHAMTDPGLQTLTLTGTLPLESQYSGKAFAYSQSVLIRNGGYPFDPVLTVPPETIDPAVTKPEDAQWAALAAPFTPQKLWDGIFLSPAPPPFSDCWPSQFGNRRSYNGSAYIYFHTGLDFCGGVGDDILAPAGGKVVFAGPLTVRGNATMIDHGWGVYSGYMHQSEIMVEIGDFVTPGQLIGLVGGTGRVTGAHLHWEIWAGGVQVDPIDWLDSEYP
jgi:murein DD-endopeptidase MepM/ murein hydrolase activator NlpD